MLPEMHKMQRIGPEMSSQLLPASSTQRVGGTVGRPEYQRQYKRAEAVQAKKDRKRTD